MTNDMALLQEQFRANPYAYFDQFRDNPIETVDFLGFRTNVATGYKEVEAILKDPRFIREWRKVAPSEQVIEPPKRVQPVVYLMTNMMLFRDAPDHTRLRSLVNKAFTPRMVERLRPQIEETADDLIERMKQNNEHELIRDFSYYLPVVVIAELIGVPREDREYFRKWADAFVRFIDFDADYERMEMVADDIRDSAEYFRSLIQKRRVDPREDLISGLIQVEEAGDSLNEDEMVATCLLLMIAGHETTVNLITNGFYLLMKHPEQLALLKADPSLVPNAVEETLRYEPPVLFTSRIASDDMEMFGKELKKSQEVMVLLGAANRDPRVFNDSNTFDITRKNIKHLSFASGPHFCLGAPLARLEGQIALEKLVTRLQNPTLLQEPEWRDNIIFRGFKTLHINAGVI